jgi:hypothetical protein
MKEKVLDCPIITVTVERYGRHPVKTDKYERANTGLTYKLETGKYNIIVPLDEAIKNGDKLV